MNPITRIWLLAFAFFLIPNQQAFAASREWTVMVYLAADNNLATSGVIDFEEMEAAGGSSSKVQLVTQTEFSPSYLRRVGVTSSRQLNLKNWKTFRYAFPKGNRRRVGPDGKVLDYKSRRMTSSNELVEFVKWGKRRYPAKKYALVLWDHGGGHLGLLEDATSSTTRLMSLQEMRSALGRAGGVDLLAFDMCLMGGYEVLAAADGLADTVVASEETIPGEGFPYTAVLKRLKSKPSMSAAQFGKVITQVYTDSYRNSSSSTTLAAYKMQGFLEVERAFSTLKTEITANLDSDVRTALEQAATNAQTYDYKFLKDVVDTLAGFSSNLQTLGGARAAALIAPIDAVLTAVTSPNFLLSSKVRSGTGLGVASVDRSRGLTFVLPGADAREGFSLDGTRSLAYYEQQVPSRAWPAIVRSYAENSVAAPIVDVAEDKIPEWYLTWSSKAEENGAEVDMVVVEPSGDIFLPADGTTTPNGRMSADSSSSGYPFEAYRFNQQVDSGVYVMLAFLRRDAANYRPLFDVYFRRGAEAEFASLYDPDFPVLSTDVSFRDDSDFSIARVLENDYTDLKVASTWCFGDGCSSSRSVSNVPDLLPTKRLATTTRLTLSKAQERTIMALFQSEQSRLSAGIQRKTLRQTLFGNLSLEQIRNLDRTALQSQQGKQRRQAAAGKDLPFDLFQ